MSTHQIVHTPVHSSKSMFPSDRLLQAAQLAANGHITETPFGWYVSDPNGEHLVVWTEPFFVCGCKSEACPHTLAVTIYDRAAKTASKESRAGRLDLVTKAAASSLVHANKFEQLTLQVLQNACGLLSDVCVVCASSSIFIDPELTQLEERLDHLFRAPSSNAHQHTTSSPWPKRTGPARPTDQLSGQLPSEEIRRLFGASDEVPRERHENGYNTLGEVTNFEWQWLYERTTDTFGEEITSELFNDVLGGIPHEKEGRFHGAQMQPLYERFVDTFGETSTFSLFADAFQ